MGLQCARAVFLAVMIAYGTPALAAERSQRVATPCEIALEPADVGEGALSELEQSGTKARLLRAATSEERLARGTLACISKTPQFRGEMRITAAEAYVLAAHYLAALGTERAAIPPCGKRAYCTQ